MRANGATCRFLSEPIVVVTVGFWVAGIDAVARAEAQSDPAGREVRIAMAQRTALGTPPYNTLFLNRCSNGCVVRPGIANSIADTSSIVSASRRLGAFPYDDATWNGVVSCVKDTLEAFDVAVTDVDPGKANHFEIMVGNLPSDLGVSSSLGGMSQVPCVGRTDTTYVPNALVFDFAGVWGGNVEQICSTAAQEFAHSFGLDHSMNASDPMTYFQFAHRRYFSDTEDRCGSDCQNGETSSQIPCTGANRQEHPCICTHAATQNTFERLRTVFGPGTPTPPVVAITAPQDGASVADRFTVAASVTDDAALIVAELRIDDALVATAFAAGPYAFLAPSSISEGLHRVEVTAYDAHGTPGTTAIEVTVKPASECSTYPCTDAGATCVGTETCWHGDDDHSGGCATGGGGSTMLGGVAAALVMRRRRRN